MKAWTLALVVLACGCATSRPVEKPEGEARVERPPHPGPLPLGERGVVPLQATEPLERIVQRNLDTPLVTFRLVFRTGSVDDPAGKEGLTALTAAVMEQGGTASLSSAELLQALFPMAAELSLSVDKELTVYSGRVHKDFLPRFLPLFTEVLTAPRMDPREFERLKADALNAVRNGLRNEDDETLGRVALDSVLYAGTPLAHFTGGTVQGLSSLTLEDVKAHAKRVFTQDRLIVGLAGPVDEALEAQVHAALSALPPTGAPRPEVPPAPKVARKVLILEKPALSTAISMGYTYPLRRDHPDFPAVAFAMSYLGEHRQSTGVLYNELREARGLNYGDYAYAEVTGQTGFNVYPQPNVARTQQMLSVWIRPVEPQNAVFATRGALHFLRQLASAPIPQEAFDRARGFLTGYTRLWEQTDAQRLGWAIDARLYGTPEPLARYREALGTLTPASVHAAVQRHVQPESLNFVFVTKDASSLAEVLRSQAPSPITYPTPKEATVLEADARIIGTPLPVDAGQLEIRPAAEFMER